MTYLNKTQLAYILDIKVEDARAKMCAAYTEERTGFTNDVKGAEWEKKKIKDNYPAVMPIELLSRRLNLPNLQTAADDIEQNYLKRPGSRRYILRDFPEKFIKKAEDDGKQFPIKIEIPPALRSMLPEQTKREIYNYWKDFKCANLQPRFIIPSV